MTATTTVTPPPDSRVCARVRVFVGSREARLLGTRAYFIEGLDDPLCGALVELPWVLCHCDGDEAGHPLVASVVIELCGTDSDGADVYWDTGVVVEESGAESDDWDEESWSRAVGVVS